MYAPFSYFVSYDANRSKRMKENPQSRQLHPRSSHWYNQVFERLHIEDDYHRRQI